MTVKDLLNSKVHVSNFRDFNSILVECLDYDFNLFQNKSNYTIKKYGKYNYRVGTKLCGSFYNKTNLEDKL